ncbi:translation initiation factor IF-2 subunit gamma [Candidatus Woesearchaeota archaeon]|nr:translation initiation factor IF-2 subunit gamma [Candidatus Woesearchaeota archaeon]
MVAKKKEPKADVKVEASEAKESHAKAAKHSQDSQPDVNIGIVGHVDHGKTTLVQSLSGKWTAMHSEEIKRGITIRLGYADFEIHKVAGKPEPDCYSLKDGELLRKVSLVDAPGHESLMATMLCGANIMDGALLLVAANEQCPQPQTQEHLKALEIIGLKNLVIVQNKIDLANEEQAKKNLQQIKDFIKGTPYEHAPIIPISAQHNINIDALLWAIQTYIPTPARDTTKEPLFFVARSFDINKPGTTPDKMVGGILGGALKQGTLKIGDELTILPGYEVAEKNQKVWKPLSTKVAGLMSGTTKTNETHPGGTVAILTALDPNIVKSDKLVGSVVGITDKLPKVWSSFSIEPHLLDRVVGAKDKLVVDPVKLGEMLMLNVNASATVGVVKDLSKGLVKLDLRRPVCADPGSRITISRNVGQRWRLIGYGLVKA